MRRYHQPSPVRKNLVPVQPRQVRTLFDATTRQRPQPYFGKGLLRYVPYHAAPASIADMAWYSSQSGRTAEPLWDEDIVDEMRALESAIQDRYASLSL